jgi:glycerol-3-phosphate acyltransferase PlsY
MESLLVHERELIAILSGYVLGCIQAGYWLVRLKTRQDIRSLGSGSTGASNVGRVLGRTGFLLTVLMDMLKGACALWVAKGLGAQPWSMMPVLLAVVTGHIFPPQLRWRGGKGLAAGCGALLVFDFRLALIVMVLAGVLGFLAKQATLCLMAVLITTPILAIGLGHTPADAITLAATVLLILVAHRSNILSAYQHLRSGKEYRDETEGRMGGE